MVKVEFATNGDSKPWQRPSTVTLGHQAAALFRGRLSEGNKPNGMALLST